MFPETKSRETLRLEGKQNSLFPSGAHIKCIIQIHFSNYFYFLFSRLTFHASSC